MAGRGVQPVSEWHGWRELMNCGHYNLSYSERRIGQSVACYLCPTTTHNPGSPGIPVAAVRLVAGIDPVSAPQPPDSWGSEHWFGT